MPYEIRDPNANLILNNRIVLVTGASGGIGSKTAELLAANGARVAVHYNSNVARAEEVVRAIKEKNGSAAAFQADLTKTEEVDRLFEHVISVFGGLDIVVVNAGIFPPDNVPLDQMDDARLERVVQTVQLGTVRCVRAFFRYLRTHPRPGANVVIIGSTSGIFGEADHTDYTGPKAALVGYTLTWGNEITRLVPDGRVNLVAPGWLRSPMTEQFMGDLKAIRAALQTRAIRRIGRPEDTAKAVLFLASPLAAYITKQVLRVDGGMEGRRLWSEADNAKLSIEQMT